MAPQWHEPLSSSNEIGPVTRLRVLASRRIIQHRPSLGPVGSLWVTVRPGPESESPSLAPQAARQCQGTVVHTVCQWWRLAVEIRVGRKWHWWTCDAAATGMRPGRRGPGAGPGATVAAPAQPPSHPH